MQKGLELVVYGHCVVMGASITITRMSGLSTSLVNSGFHSFPVIVTMKNNLIRIFQRNTSSWGKLSLGSAVVIDPKPWEKLQIGVIGTPLKLGQVRGKSR